MRRRKGNRGRPRKVKKARSAKLKETISLDSKLCEDNSEDGTTSLKSDGAVAGFIGLDKTGPFSYRVGSVNIELEGSDEDIKPVIEENDIKLEVECGSNTAYMFLSRLCQGSKGSCIEFEGAWLTPNEFQFVSGRETAKDWKRSIRHFGRSLKLLITKGILTVHPAACRCDSCRLLSTTTNEPNLVREKRERDAREKKARGIEGGASGSDKEEGESRGSAEDGDDESGDAEDSQGSAENGEEESGSEEEEEDEGKVEENNNEAGDKDSEDSDGSSSSSDSSSSSSDSDSDNDGDKKDDDDEENKDKAKAEAEEAMEEEHAEEEKEEETSPVKMSEDNAEQNQNAEPAAVSDKMEVDGQDDSEEHNNAEVSEATEQPVSSEQKVSPKDASDEKQANDDVQDANADHANSESEEMALPADDMLTTSKCDDDVSKNYMNEDTPMDDIKSENSEPADEDDVKSESTSNPEPTPESIHTAVTDVKTSPEKADSVNGSSNDATSNNTEDISNNTEDISNNTEDISKDNVKDAVAVSLDKPSSQKDEESRGSMSSTPSEDAASSTLSSHRGQSPLTMKRSTPTLSEIPLKKSAEKSTSSGGKSRLSNIIDLLRTSKEKETKQQVTTDRPEEKRQEKRPAEVKDTKSVPPLPSKRDEIRPRKPEREEPIQPKPSREEQKMSQKAHDAMRLPMGGRLPFGFPPPEILERASREAHEQLSKSHRQFERNLETLMAQNMNPFVPELSMFSLPEHRAQMEYNYLKNMERLDQMAKERMATMADLRHQQMLRQHNSFVAKLAEQQTKSTRHELPESHPKSSREKERERESRKSQPQQSKRTPTREETPKVPSAHRAQPEVRKDKPDQRSLQTPPAAHHNKTTSRPSSAGTKPPSSLPLPASTGRAAHPSGPSSTHSRNSPMIAPIAPPLQIWSSCFPYVIPPPTMEMQRLTQFFPNLNGGLFSADGVSKRDSESPILDLSTKKRKHEDREQAVRRKQAKLSSGSHSVHSSPQTNGTSRDSSQSRPQHSKDSVPSRAQPTKDSDSAKERPSWASHERTSALTCTCALQHLNDIRNWSVDDVCCFLKGLEGCTLYVDSFRRHGIDGKTLMMLTTDALTKSLGMRIGAATFLTESVAKRALDLQKIVPCEYCRIKNQKV